MIIQIANPLFKNKNLKTLVIFLFLFVLNSPDGKCQINSTPIIQDSVYSISNIEFDSMIQAGIETMRKKKDLSVEQTIVFIKLHNTIILNRNYDQNKLCKFFLKSFDPYTEKSAKLLGSIISTGMGYYSPKYRVHLGGNFINMEKSSYKVR